jgi:TPR repeat protein
VGVHGSHTSLRYWGESNMKGALGYKGTLGVDANKKEAKKFFKDNLGMDDSEADERLAQMGYDKNLKGDKVRLIENPKQYVQDYVESVLSKKSKSDDLVNKEVDEDVEKDLEPIIRKQILALKNTLTKNDISIKDVIKLLNKKDNE